MAGSPLHWLNVKANCGLCRHCTHEQVPYLLPHCSLLLRVCISFLQLFLVPLQPQHRVYMK